MISDEKEPLVTTYLQMQSHLEIRKSKSEIRNADFEVRELKKRDGRFNRKMYFKVGEQWKWIDKRPWTNEQWQEYASDPMLRTFAAYHDGKLAGYYELKRSVAWRSADQRSRLTGHTSRVTCHNEEVEIAYFGLLQNFVGRGLGGRLLTSAIENAWAWTPTPSRVWVHTCNRDHPNALANYQARGFKIYKIEKEPLRAV